MPSLDRQEPAPRGAPADSPPAGPTATCSPEERLACLLSIAHDLTSAPDLSTGLRSFASGLARFIEYQTLGVLLLDELGRELRFELAVGYPPEVAAHWRFGMGQGLVGTAARTGEPVAVDDVEEDSRYIRACPGVRSELAIPLLAKGRVIGVLDLTSAQPGAFPLEQRRLLSTLAGHLASAIESARLHQNTREQARTLSLLHEISHELISILDRRQLLEQVARRVRRLIDYDLFSVLLWNPEAELLEPWIAVLGEGVEVERRHPVPLGTGLCGTGAALRQSIRVSNVHLDPRFVACTEGLEVASELVVPLLFKDRLLGVIDLESTHFDAFTSQHEQLLSTLASSLAIALENASLYERLRDNERRIEQELAMAREIQEQLLPTTTPWLPSLQIGIGYEPARHLGGDFYDFLHYCDGKVAVAVGDVAGKATAAALYGSLALGILREFAGGECVGPAATLAAMNEKLRAFKVGRRFLAMTFAVLDGDGSALTLANSGLPHPFLVRAGEVRPLTVEGVPLGLLPDRQYRELRLRLEPGDAVVICTDGVEESRDRESRELGDERVRAALARLAGRPPQEIAQGLLAACRAFSGAGEPSDDRTIVILHRSE